jgi:hypothetical protein
LEDGPAIDCSIAGLWSGPSSLRSIDALSCHRGVHHHDAGRRRGAITSVATVCLKSAVVTAAAQRRHVIFDARLERAAAPPASSWRRARSTSRWRRKRNACSVRKERGRQLRRP